MKLPISDKFTLLKFLPGSSSNTLAPSPVHALPHLTTPEYYVAYLFLLETSESHQIDLLFLDRKYYLWHNRNICNTPLRLEANPRKTQTKLLCNCFHLQNNPLT